MSNGTTADGFNFPCGPPDGAGYYVAAGLAEQAYYDRFNAWHTGEDWNGLGGGDSDLGDPVHATANGQVIASDYYTPSWGNIVLIQHQIPDGDNVWSQYAHLRERRVAMGDYVARGQRVPVARGSRNARYTVDNNIEFMNMVRGLYDLFANPLD